MNHKTSKRVANFDPAEISDAFRVCVRKARAEKYRSVSEIAEAMGENAEVLYKWLQTSRMPAVLLPAFEIACGADDVSRALARAVGNLTIRSRELSGEKVDVLGLQRDFIELVVLLISEQSQATVEPRVKAINRVMDTLADLREQIAWEADWKDGLQ